jgi:hypothetical protein
MRRPRFLPFGDAFAPRAGAALGAAASRVVAGGPAVDGFRHQAIELLREFEAKALGIERLVLLLRCHDMLLSRAKRHRCPQMSSREWEVRVSPSDKGEGGGTPKGAP